MSRQTRRTFLMRAAGAAAAASVLPRVVRGDVNSQIRMAVIGFNGRGGSHISAFRKEIVALCDCDSQVLNRFRIRFKRRFRRLGKLVNNCLQTAAMFPG